MEHKIYMNYIHPSSLLRQLSELWKADQLCDAVITVDKIIVAKAHKVVLFAVSPKLKTDSSHSSQSPILDVCLPAGVSHRAVHAFLQYIYEGYLILTKKLAADLLKISKFLRITCLTNCCSDYLDSFKEDVIVLDENPSEIKTEEFNHVRKSTVEEDEGKEKSEKDEHDHVASAKSKKSKSTHSIPSSPTQSNRSPSRDTSRQSNQSSFSKPNSSVTVSDSSDQDKNETSYNQVDVSGPSSSGAPFVVQEAESGNSVLSDLDVNWKTPGKTNADDRGMVQVKTENLDSCSMGSGWKDTQNVSQSCDQNTLSPSSFPPEIELVDVKQEPEDVIVEPNFFQSITSSPSHDQGQYEGQMWFSSESGGIESLNQTAPVESMSSPMVGPSHMNYQQRSLTPFSSLKQMRAQQSIKRSIQSSVTAAKRARTTPVPIAPAPAGNPTDDEQLLEMEQEGDNESQEIESVPTPTALIVNRRARNKMAHRFASNSIVGKSKAGNAASQSVKGNAKTSSRFASASHLSSGDSSNFFIVESEFGGSLLNVKTEPQESLFEIDVDTASPSTSAALNVPSQLVQVDDEEFSDQFLRESNKRTHNKTTYDLKLLISFLEQPTVNEFRPIHKIPPKELCPLLCKFIMNVRKADGSDYEPTSLRGFMASFDRHLKLRSYGFSLSCSYEFGDFRDVLRRKQKLLKQYGKGNTPNRAEPISEEEITSLWNSGELGCERPQSVINTLWFYFSMYFGMKSYLEHHSLQWGDVKLSSDSKGNEYLEYDEEQVKLRIGSKHVRAMKPKIYRNIVNPERCIVKVYKFYSARRPPDYCSPDDSFYIAPCLGVPKSGETWFKGNAVGLNKLATLLKRMIKNSGIHTNRRLSNHSITKHVIQKRNLMNDGFI